MAANVFLLGGAIATNIAEGIIRLYLMRRKVAVIEPGAGPPMRLNWGQVSMSQFHHTSTTENPILMVQPETKGMFAKPTGDWLRLEGSAALAAAGPILAAVNLGGGSRKAVAKAAARLDRLTPGEAMFGSLVVVESGKQFTRHLHSVDLDLRLALEMAANEDKERVWLSGELLDLERAWQRAEELAAIADPLGTEDLTEQLDALKRRGG